MNNNSKGYARYHSISGFARYRLVLGFAPILAVVILGLALVIGYLVLKPTLPSSEPTPSTPSEESPANWETYIDQELGISFQYPPEWGNIKKDKRTDCSQGAPQPCVHIFLTLPKVHDYNILLGSGNVSYINNVVGRGAYFGERIGKAYRNGTPFEKFVEDYCTTNESELCVTKTNQNGVLYTKSLETNYETLEGLALYYFVYHPNHQFEGITLSNEMFLNTAFSEGSEKNLDQILSTFKFTSSPGEDDLRCGGFAYRPCPEGYECKIEYTGKTDAEGICVKN